MKFRCVVIFAFAFLIPAGACPQSPERPAPAKLADLLSEAEKNSPQIQAARHAWESAKLLPSQVSTLPDPQFVLQHVSVGSPRPFAGYTNSDFAYLGLGFSQDLPYPGKLRLRGEVAKKEGDVAEQRYESARRSVFIAVKTVYSQLSYLQRRRVILEEDGLLLDQIEQAAEVRYRSGMSNQHDVLQSQLERTKLLREVTANELESGRVQAQLKQLLNRSQSSSDIEATDVTETRISLSFDELLAAAAQNNPDIAGMRKMTEKAGIQVELAKKDFYPDFNLQYMWQRTDPTQFRSYYSLTLGVKVPIYKRRRQQPELAQAESDQQRAKSEEESQIQQIAFELRQQFLAAEKSTHLLKIYREGLLPQARAELQAATVAYQANREDFQALLASFLDVLKLDEEYRQTLSEHEAAIAQIEGLSGVSLR